MMRTLAKAVIALLSITSGFAASAEKTFHAAPPDQYAHQEGEQVVVGAKAFDSSDQTKQVFGKKVDLNRYGVLPVLLVVKNNRSKALDLNGIEVKLVPKEGQSVNPIEPADVATVAKPVKPPKVNASPIPHIHKDSMDSLAIVEKAFVAKTVPPGQQVSGFFYFQAHPEPGLKFLVQGIFERASGKQIMYFEIPLSPGSSE
jgi:hypothetical protein